ncbi:Os06g0557600, partial [Oryza sativa Japonica Group]
NRDETEEAAARRRSPAPPRSGGRTSAGARARHASAPGAPARGLRLHFQGLLPAAPVGGGRLPSPFPSTGGDLWRRSSCPGEQQASFRPAPWSICWCPAADEENPRSLCPQLRATFLCLRS